MRAVLFEYIYGRQASDIEDLDLGVPDEHVRLPARKVRTDRGEYPDARVVKTHKPYQPRRDYRRVVYLVRDPRDVYPSFWRFRRQNGLNENTSLEEFIDQSLRGEIWPGSWYSHVCSWTDTRRKDSIDFELIRYEDLRGGQAAASEKLATGLQFSDPGRLHEIISKYSLSKMKNIEDAKKNTPRSYNGKRVGFINSGGAPGEMREQVEAYISQHAPAWKPKMEMLGYW